MIRVKPKIYGNLNYIGLYTLYIKEIKKFTTIPTQTIFAPMVTSVLFFSIFNLSIGKKTLTVGTLPFLQFLIPGLIMMKVIQNTFSNTSSSVIASKMLGSIVDLLMPPLSLLEIQIAFVCAGVTRGIVTALASAIALSFFVEMHMHSIVYIPVFIFLASVILSLMGFLSGIWGEKWDDISAITNYIIVPLSFLSGTFYSMKSLPDIAQKIAYINPFFYMIDGLRYAMTGYSEVNPLYSAFVLLCLAVILWFVNYRVLKSGYRLRS